MSEGSGRAVTPTSSEQLMAAVRVHLDRVHDLVRRLDCPPDTAVAVVRESAVDLVEVVARSPETIPDAVGWWVARARTRADEVSGPRLEAPVGGGVLAGDRAQRVLADALDELPEQDRVALLLRDSYDLPATTVAEALRTGEAAALTEVGSARLAFLALVEQDVPVPDPGHGDVGALARLGEGGPPTARDAAARRHALSCALCREITDAQQRAHVLLSGLTVVAPDDPDRADVLRRVGVAAAGVLPSSTAIAQQLRREGSVQQRRLISPLLAVAGIVLAMLAGVGVGLLLSRDTGTQVLAGPDGLPPGVPLLSPSPLRTAAVPSPPTVPEQLPRTTVEELAPSPRPPAPSPAPARVTLSPAQGQNGDEITVAGTGFPAGARITVRYLDPTGGPTGSGAEATAGEGGAFSAALATEDPNNLPGEHRVVAEGGGQRAEATYLAQ